MRSFFARFKNQERSLPLVIIPVVITAIVAGLEALGGLELLELKTFDWWIRRQPDQGVDDRILVVGITEKDLQTYRWPIPDQILATAFDQLQTGGAKAIGLDLYRDLPQPPGTAALNDRLQAPNVVGILQLGIDTGDWVDPPPVLLNNQVGFNDLLLDSDSVVRRALLTATDQDTIYQALAFRLAQLYLQDQPTTSDTQPEQVVWGATTFHPLTASSGGYTNTDDRGYQILFDYQTGGEVSTIVSLGELLAGTVENSLINDRIVLIGTLAPSLKDLFFTPHSAADPDTPGLPGVLVHAHLTRQLVDLGLGHRSVFRFWPRSLEILWMWSAATIGVLILHRLHHPVVLPLVTMGSGLLLWGIQGLLLGFKIWIPIVAPSSAYALGFASMLVYSRYQIWQSQQTLLQRAQEQSAAIAQLQTLIQESARTASNFPPYQQPEFAPTQLPEGETEPFTATAALNMSGLNVSGLGNASPFPAVVNTTTTPGGSLAGRYQIQKVLGEGGFGITYLAKDSQRPGSPPCVIKRLSPARRDPRFLQTAQRLFQNEALILEQLGRSHDRIPQLLAYFQQDQEFYLVQDYVDGQPLNQELNAHTPLSPQAVVELLRDVLPTLQYIHRHQVIHRDLKPSNLIRRTDRAIVLIDFGAVKHLSPRLEDMGEAKTIAVGTTGYSPPEQMAGYPRLNSDLYSLGMIAIQALTGNAPQELPSNVETGDPLWQPIAQDIHQGNPILPALIKVINKLIEFNACDRYPSATVVLQDLKKIKTPLS